MKLKPFSVLIPWLLMVCGALVDAKTLELPAIQVVPITDSATGREYELYIKLPEQYDSKGDKTHPAIYIADALWHIEIISGSIEYLVEDAILVGISWEKGVPPQRSRMRDYTPVKYDSTTYQHPTGKAPEHLAFILNDVFKYVETQYNVDPSKRSYFGYSLSSTFGSYILLTRPNTFKNYILGSPATLPGGQFIHDNETVSLTVPKSLDANVFVSIGANEKPKNIEQAIGLAHFLNSRKTNTSQVELKIIESTDHRSAFPISAMQSLYWLAELSK